MDVLNHAMSRRQFLLTSTASAAIAATGNWLTSAQAFAHSQNIVDLIRTEAAISPITVYELRGGLSVLEGSGGNIGVLTGAEGKLLIDAGITASRSRIVEAHQSLGQEPIVRLINTHWHFDHTDGNEWIGEGGATILAHENCRSRLLTSQRVEDWDFVFPPSPLWAVPNEVIGSQHTLDHNGERLRLEHHPAAHTDGDISVLFERANVIQVADLYWNGIYPFIDYSTGGSIDGMISAVSGILKVADGKTIIIPGHGNPVSSARELAEYLDMLSHIRERVGVLKAKGLTVDEVIDEKPTAPFDEKWGRFVVTPAFFTKLVYRGS